MTDSNLNPNIYFELKIGPALDELLPIFPIALILFLLFKFPEFSSHISGVLKTSRSKVLWGWSVISCVIIFHSIFSYFEIAELQVLIKEKKYEMVVGCVENYSAEVSPTKYKTERFVIKDTQFEFSNFTNSIFFTGDDHIDNFIDNGKCLEVSFIQDGYENKIIKIIQLLN
ncbi:hypothetical protein [Pseudoalteromonas phenolica]|uniref:Uncharacterized protein n=1 Tax=Pseudoalteromonas phenolica TaxID=161398 RepID=A0A0S2K3L7_9GAMM|nr:hypothetical protein [Pseudoalteromonas phenolica]ALO42659.1 hypothetical protein PP2015_2162 [Pseudoalteromonas phenolica]MBE0356235.1 hypothetical protein [Pseudoalteromonas phenolica O-BC30]RXE91474.1 hypothetical protein D9981_22480 [Pseudoalteromonas phenolica O-BC30]